MLLAGASLSLTGRFALQGRQAQRGLGLWATWVNEAGGLPVGSGGSRLPVSLRIYDDRSRIADAQANVLRLLTGDRVDLLFGPYGSALTLAVAPIAEAHGKILWNHGGSSDEIFARGWRVLIGGSAPASAYFAGFPGWLRGEEPGLERLTVLYSQGGTFAGQVARGLAEAAAREGFRQVALAPCELAAAEPSRFLGEHSEGAPQAIVLVGSYPDEVRVIREHGVSLRGVGRIAAVSAGLLAFGDAVGGESEGIIGTSQWEPGCRTQVQAGPDEVWVRSRFRQAFGEEPEYPAVQALGLGVAAAECVHRADDLRDEALREAAAGLDVTTCFGRFRIDRETGRQVGHQPVLVEWRGGRKRVVWPAAGR
ncbi:MAG: amino acid ABC transporter substrate-binding protein [candidate division NC10 bacterium]|nr:amino acid ABC transporter substrate-binding protein [candidate division NC10 bacterium]